MKTARITDHALIIFIKNPEKGKVKTRLARTVGDDRALRIYEALLEHTRKVTLAVDTDRLLYYSTHIDENDEWPPGDFQKFLQQGESLGEKMENAFRQAFESYGKVVIIGSDCPGLTPAILREAFEQLNAHDFVIGPAKDGGYYLLGMSKPAPALFREMVWSTEKVLSETLSRIRSQGGSCYKLPELSDIDNEEDWARYGWLIS